jgi:hypothetical protein
MPEYLTKREGYWHFTRRVPLDFAKLDPRGIIRHSTKVKVSEDRRGIKAGKIADEMNRDLMEYWRGLSQGKPQEAADRYNEARRSARVLGSDYAETAELSNRPTLKVLERLVQDHTAEPQIIDTLVLMRAFLKIADAADRRKVIELAAALARNASPPIAPS